ncbi:aldehyde dehydrogenase family protein [Streptomyces sp. 796.1]|uniref:aldehyde dehydrogenase family protein n=1 Tax=Streptomyces sp. 796.1 TaxID=3163029 RepID=UPI0039C9B29D
MPAPVWSVDPRTGKQREQVALESDEAAVDRAVRAAHAARGDLADRTTRAAFLRTAAALLEADGAAVVALADAETALGTGRLTGELARTAYQLRAFADVVDEGRYLDVTIDHALDSLTPPRPDLRRYRIPLGVVAVYSASNFPLAFSVPGGDTASALAAGCPVVVKAHPDHPATSERCAQLLRRAAEQSGLAADIVTLVHGFAAGTALINHPLVRAAGFTGSIRGGRALYDAAAARPHPIPFYGELGSLNPVVITEAAAVERAAEIGGGLAGSVTLGVGQFCVKPGLVLAPASEAGDQVLAALAAAVAAVPPGVLLDARMRDAYLAGVRERAALPAVRSATPAPDDAVPALISTDPSADAATEHAPDDAAEPPADAAADPTPARTADASPAGQPGATPAAGREADGLVRAAVLTVPAAELARQGPYDLLLEECFGPVTVVARYAHEDEIGAVLRRLPGNLTATVQLSAAECAGDDAAPTAGGDAAGEGRGARLLAELTPLAGRLLVNGWPTGVAVAPAQHHGGPYPATTSTTTSVGAGAIDRWLRPVVYQDTPPALLPPELRAENPLGLPRRVDGRGAPDQQQRP